MVSSYHTRRQVSSNADNISTYLRCSYPERNNYTTHFFGRSLDVAVTSKPHSVRNWIHKSLSLHRHRLYSHHRRNIIVGLGMQWRPIQYSNPCPATIQICIGHRILIFQIRRSSIPGALSRFLRDCRFTFVGYNIGYDCRLLKSNHGLEVAFRVELRSVSGMGTASMERMAERILGFQGVKKSRRISRSDWDAPHLSVDQVQYAALDAYLSFQLGVRLVASPALTKRTNCKMVFQCNMVYAVEAESRSGLGLGNLEEDESGSYFSDDSGLVRV